MCTFLLCISRLLAHQTPLQPQVSLHASSSSSYSSLCSTCKVNALTLPVGSKDLNQVAAQSNQCSRVICPPCSSCDSSSVSNAQGLVKQQSSDALGIESAHDQDKHKSSLRSCPSLQTGDTTLGTVSNSVPSHAVNAPQFLDNSNHTQPSLSVVLPDVTFPQAAIRSLDDRTFRSTGDQKKRTCALPYVLFAIDGTWQEAKEIYKVDTSSAAFCLLATTANAEDPHPTPPHRTPPHPTPPHPNH